MIQVNIHPGCEHNVQLKKSLQKLKSIAQNRDSLYLLKGPLPKNQYSQCLQKAAIVLLPYDQNHYKHTISGILLEAFALGKPVITTSGTWLAKQVKRYGGGITLGEAFTDAILAAIESIFKDYPKFCNEARSAGEKLKRIYNAEQFARRVIKTVQKRSLIQHV